MIFFAKWKIASPKNFKVLVKYLSPELSSGGNYAITIERPNAGNKSIPERIYSFETTVLTDPKGTTPVTAELGTIPLGYGTYMIKISPITITKNELMKLLEVQLIPLDK